MLYYFIYFNHNETRKIWARNLLCIIVSFMFKTWASLAKVWSVNLNSSSLKLVNFLVSGNRNVQVCDRLASI